MKTDLSGKVAYVSGGAAGIGAAIAQIFAEHGARVAIGDVQVERGEATAAQIRDRGGKAIFIRHDAAEEAQWIATLERAIGEFGGLDIVVNNAAILVPGTIESIQPRHIDLIWQVDLRGPILLMRDAIPHLRAAGGGHIINVSSVAGVFPGPGPYKEPRKGGAFYGMIKAGLERLTQGLAMELQDDKISVNVLSPQGRIKTPGNLFAQNDPENPNLDFEPATAMARGARWICEQPPTVTGNIWFDEDLCREKGISLG